MIEKNYWELTDKEKEAMLAAAVRMQQEDGRLRGPPRQGVLLDAQRQDTQQVTVNLKFPEKVPID
ncbi:MAG: hypothetical protein ACLQSX_00835 [Smithella sp.]